MVNKISYKSLIVVILITTIFSCARKTVINEKNELNISIPKNFSPEYLIGIKDAQEHLKKRFGRNVSLSYDDTNAKYLLTNQPPANLNPKHRKAIENNPKESFYIDASPEKTIIYGKTDLALIHGIYFYLEKLGFRWYLPGDIWTILSDKNSPPPTFKLLEIPDFNVRNFYGSGAFQVNHIIDPSNKRKKDWELWKLRNRFGGDRKILGHQWENFLRRNKEIFLKNPEYLAEIDGKRKPFSQNTKLCISNDEVVKLFVEDRIKVHEANLKKYGPDHELTSSIGAEPSDGGGHCTCDNCLRMGSVSTRVFHLANAVADEFDKKYPNVKVSMLAYNKHADTPDINLHPKVDVAIIPRGFHRVAPESVYIKKWQDKIRRPMGLYDYWAIPIWQLDLPGFDLYGVDEKLRFWKKNGIDALHMESSYSKGAIGLGLYQLSKIGWDINQNSENLLNEFLTVSFGDAKPPIEKIFRRWSNGFLGLEEIPYALRDIAEATKLAKTELEKKRVQEWAEYIHFVKLMSEFKALKRKSAERISKADEIIEYTWANYWNYMIHTTYLQFVITHHHEKQEVLQRNWSLKKDKMDLDKWNKLNKKANSIINRQIAKDQKEYPILFKEPKLKFNFENGNSIRSVNSKNSLSSFLTKHSQELLIYASPSNPIYFEYELKKNFKEKSDVSVLISPNDSEEPLFFEKLNKKKSDIKYRPKSEGLFKISIPIHEADLILKLNDGTAIKGYPRRAFNFKKLFTPLPKNTTEVIYSAKRKMMFQTLDGQILVSKEIGDNLYKISIPKNSDINAIVLLQKEVVVKFINIPDLYFLNPNNLLQVS